MTLAHDRLGSGPPLLLVHPLGADRRVWRPVLDRLAAERDVVAVDLPGFGGSPLLPEQTEPTPAALARAVAAFAERDLGLASGAWHVAGNSLGGWVGLELGLTGAAVSVTAIAPAGLWSGPLRPRSSSGQRLARAALPLVPALTRARAVRRVALAAVVAHPERVPPADAAALIAAYARARGHAATNAAMRAGRFAALGDVPVPVTLAWPEHDRLVTRPSRLPSGVREVRLAGCGHLPMWDDPAAVADVLLRGSDAPGNLGTDRGGTRLAAQ